jgi:hypothetical protein
MRNGINLKGEIPSLKGTIFGVLLKNAKKEVKQIMEIAVVVKFIHEDNNAITSLCSMYSI